ncbi:MAG: CAP domain-containing protein [Aliishimia sp.]
MAQADIYERYMLSLINSERAEAGLNALQLELNLNESAAAHSLWMLETDKFQHAGENDSTARQRMTDAGFDFGTTSISAENLAAHSERGNSDIIDDVLQLHTNLMNSPLHRANILHPDLQYVGIGIEVGNLVYKSGEEFLSVMVTQNFARTNGTADLDIGEIQGTSANDIISSGATDDIVSGLRGNDILTGEAGDDTLHGNDGNDILNGDAGDDVLNGNRGNDIANGGADNDTINGGFGRDTIYGAAGNDILIGGRDDDRVYGGNGEDTLKGGAGSDILEGGKGNDTLQGGSNGDAFIFIRGGDEDTITDFQDNIDEVDLSSFNYASTSHALSLASQQGNDVVFDFGLGDLLIVEDTQIHQLSNDLVI